MKYTRTLRNSGAKPIQQRRRVYRVWVNGQKSVPMPSRHELAECDYFGWDNYDRADKYGQSTGREYTITSCQFCGKWHCKMGAPKLTGLVQKGKK